MKATDNRKQIRKDCLSSMRAGTIARGPAGDLKPGLIQSLYQRLRAIARQCKKHSVRNAGRIFSKHDGAQCFEAGLQVLAQCN